MNLDKELDEIILEIRRAESGMSDTTKPDSKDELADILYSLAWSGKYTDAGQEVISELEVERAKNRLNQYYEDFYRNKIPEKKVTEVEVPRLYQGVGGDSAPFYCSGCQMSETDIMENYDEGDGRYWCRCSFWDTPHNAFIDRSGGNWLGWKNKQTAQDYLNSLPIEENGWNACVDDITAQFNSRGDSDE